jgi:hypothetical protein
MLNALKNATNFTYTENGAIAHKTTKSSIVDFFATAGAMRTRNERDIITMFNKAFSEDALIAMKMLYYFRDISKGQGERRLFKVIIKYLAETQTETMKKNIKHIASFGRFDDLFSMLGTPCEKCVLELIKEQFYSDLKSDTPSLLGKWLKSENASSKETKRIAKKVMSYLGISPKEYRKSLTFLRKKINIIETKLSEKKYEEINYLHVPSCANKKYHKAFWRNDEERYREFIEAAIKGKDKNGKEVKINTKALYPYEIIRDILKNHNDSYLRYNKFRTKTNLDINSIQKSISMDALWKNLPDYVNGSMQNALAIIDTSGSMTCNDYLPMSVALSLGIYFGERNQGRFANHFITFSERPKLVEIKGTDIATKVHDIMRYEEVSNTNIKAVFDLLLNTAIKENLPQEELPEKLFIISDMQHDSATSGINRDTKRLMDYVKESWDKAGYKFPKLVYWNVDAKKDSYPMTIDDSGVQFVSGCSPVIFTNLLKDKFMSPLELVLDVVDTERYGVITV